MSAAVWFDFFLTRPYERFSILHRADIETTLLLLIIGVAVTELAVWGRRQHAVASPRAGYLDGISAAAQAVAAGGGILQGRFLMTPGPSARPSREQRLLAAVFADQAAAALAAGHPVNQ